MENQHIFFSYSRDDSAFVLKLAKDLRAAGENIWLDQLDIKAGKRWDRAIEDALHACKTLLVVLSPTSVSSDNVMDEVSFALEENKQVIPVIHRSCSVPFRLRRLQYIDLSANYNQGLQQLIQVLHSAQPIATAGAAAAPVVSDYKSSPRKGMNKQLFGIAGLVAAVLLVLFIIFQRNSGSSINEEVLAAAPEEEMQELVPVQNTIEKVTVPNVVNMSEKDGNQKLAALGLNPIIRNSLSNCDKAPGTILAQFPAGNENAEKGTAVQLDIVAPRKVISAPGLQGKSSVRTLEPGKSTKTNAWALQNTTLEFGLAGSECTKGEVKVSHPLGGTTIFNLKAGQRQSASRFFGAGTISVTFSSNDPDARLSVRTDEW